MENQMKLFSLLGLVFLIGLVSAANTVNITAPLSDNITLSGTITITTELDSNSIDLGNATFYYKIDTGSWVQIGSQVVNVSANQTLFNTTWATTSIVDTSNMTINVTITTAAGASATSDASTNVSIDNGNPTASLSTSSLSAGTQLYLDTAFTLGLAADNTIGIESCTYYFTNSNGTITSSSVAASGEACSQTYTANNASLLGGDYSYVIQATDDNADATNSSSRSISIFNTNTLGGGGGSSTTENIEPSYNDDVSGGDTTGLISTQKNWFVRSVDAITGFFKKLFTWNWN